VWNVMTLTLVCVLLLTAHASIPTPTFQQKKSDRSDWALTDKLPGLTEPPSQDDLEAIAELHHVLDDDQNGAVDSLESEDFIREDLDISDNKEEDQRQLSLHKGDNSISVRDMQRNWLASRVHNWTTQDVEEWLVEVVGLPQYLPVFKKNRIDGHVLPRLALNKNQIVQHVLGITDQNHKNKIVLKAMDVVLFGPPTVFYNPLKDALLALAILVAICGVFLSAVQRNKAQKQVDVMMKEIEDLQLNETKFNEIQDILKEAEEKNRYVIQEKSRIENKLKSEIDIAKSEAERLCTERTGTEADKTRLKLAEQELAQVRLALRNAESKIPAYHPAKEMQSYLTITYKKERSQYNIKMLQAQEQLKEARQWSEKMKKKKIGLVHSLRMIHGGSLEGVETRICSARSALIEATAELQELVQRWRKIEAICNFSITSQDDADTDSITSLTLDSSPEPHLSRSSSWSTDKASPTNRKRVAGSLKIHDRSNLKSLTTNGSTPDLSSKDDNSSNGPSSSSSTRNSPNTYKNLLNGHDDTASDASDTSGKIRKVNKPRKMWKLLSDSRKNADPKWKHLMDSLPASP